MKFATLSVVAAAFAMLSGCGSEGAGMVTGSTSSALSAPTSKLYYACQPFNYQTNDASEMTLDDFDGHYTKTIDIEQATTDWSCHVVRIDTDQYGGQTRMYWGARDHAVLDVPGTVPLTSDPSASLVIKYPSAGKYLVSVQAAYGSIQITPVPAQ